MARPPLPLLVLLAFLLQHIIATGSDENQIANGENATELPLSELPATQNPSLSALSNTSRQLVYVHVLWRHGERAPGGLPYPNDPYNETFWPRGWDRLTNRGIRQMFKLGRFLRERYAGNFIRRQYDPYEVEVISSQSARALTSAQAVATGLFPPFGSFDWTPNRRLDDWQPVPVKTAYGMGEPDPLLKPTGIKCKAYRKTVQLANQAMQNNLTLDYADLFELLGPLTGLEVVDYHNVDDLYDIHREMKAGLQPPTWVWHETPGHPNVSIIDSIREIRRLKRTSQFDSVEKAVFVGGFLLNDWIERMVHVAGGGRLEEGSRATLYSAHDGTLSALLGVLDLSNGRLVPYAATVIGELYEHANKTQYSVEFHYRNDTSTTPYRLHVPGCGEPCFLSTLYGLVQDRLVRSEKQLKKLCKWDDTDEQRFRIKNNQLLMKKKVEDQENVPSEEEPDKMNDLSPPSLLAMDELAAMSESAEPPKTTAAATVVAINNSAATAAASTTTEKTATTGMTTTEIGDISSPQSPPPPSSSSPSPVDGNSPTTLTQLLLPTSTTTHPDVTGQ